MDLCGRMDLSFNFRVTSSSLKVMCKPIMPKEKGVFDRITIHYIMNENY